MRCLNRPGFERTPRSWTNFAAFDEEVPSRIDAQGRQALLAGDGDAKLLARRWSVPQEKIRTRVSHYRQHGIDGLGPSEAITVRNSSCKCCPSRTVSSFRVGRSRRSMTCAFAAPVDARSSTASTISKRPIVRMPNPQTVACRASSDSKST